MYRVMKFDDAVSMLLSKGNVRGLLSYDNGELRINGMNEEDLPEGDNVERLQKGNSTCVNGWYVPNECFLEIDEDNKRNDFVNRSLAILGEANRLLHGVDCVGIHCSECPLNLGREYGFGCAANLLDTMLEDERWKKNEYYIHADKAQ